MKRVLHVINGAAVGGISSMILNYYRFIDRDRIHFDFVTSTKNGHNGFELEKLGSSFFYLEKKSSGLVKYMRSLDRLIKENKYDAIHVHSDLTSYVALFVAWKNKIPIRISHGHNADSGKKTLKLFLSKIIGHFLIRVFSTKRIACSNQSAIHTFGKRSLKNNDVLILHNAINIDSYLFIEDRRIRTRKLLNMGKDDIVIGCVGRISPEKNHCFLVSLLSKLLEKNKNYKLVIVGDGDERARLERLSKKLGIESSVVFAGESSNVGDFLAAFDLFALPSISEGLGIVAIEAAASGLPVILSSNVTSELSFLPNTVYLPLENIEKWMSVIEQESNKKERTREGVIKTVLRENCYDIELESKKLEKIYEQE